MTPASARLTSRDSAVNYQRRVHEPRCYWIVENRPSPVARGGGSGWSLRSLEAAVQSDEQGVGVHVAGIGGGARVPEIGPDQPTSLR